MCEQCSKENAQITHTMSVNEEDITVENKPKANEISEGTKNIQYEQNEPDSKLDIKSAVELIFSEKKDFIIIGLTGRTGSGCSKVAELLCSNFNDLPIPTPKETDFINNEERKYQIVYAYAKKHWQPFCLIEFRNIITSFILEYDYQKFINYIKSNIKGRTVISASSKDELENKLDTNIKSEFNQLHEKRIEIKNRLNTHGEDAQKDNDVFEFFFNYLPNFTKKIQDILIEQQPNLYTIIYQLIGSNVRLSGDAYNNKFIPSNIYKMSQRVNLLIKVLRKRNIGAGGRVLIVIDAFRNPYEAMFFKDRYSAFYLMSVNTDNETRVSRLIEKGFNIKQIEKLDKQEYSGNKIGIDLFTSQDIGKCIEIADIHLFNPNKGLCNYSFLLEQLVKYVTLIMHPGLISPTHIERCMQIAYNAKQSSGCISRQVGAVITDSDYSIKSIGWNSTPEGQVPCNLRNINALLCKRDEIAFSEFELNNEQYFNYIESNCKSIVSDELKLNGRLMAYCFKDAYNTLIDKKNQVYIRALHGEENAFLQLVKNGGMGVKGGYLFTTASPCELCAKKAYQIGIKKVYYIDPYPGISEKNNLKCGISQPEMCLFNGVVGETFNKLYNPIMPYKDELQMLLGFKFPEVKK